AGVQLVTVHGRTRCQFYEGAADWAAIRAGKEAVRIPLVANGDFDSFEDAEHMLRLSGADAIMIGRASYGRPWFPGLVASFAATGTVPCAPAGAALAELVSEHYDAMLAHYGPFVGMRCARKHLGWYMDGTAVSPALRARVMQETNPRDVARLISIA